ncbi:MAG TPA: pyroglutamyl-peptidase I [Thermoplasmata archaeon]|nr:pyroglutamyl-peptidase I [Thermoplasmata archaeon]
MARTILLTGYNPYTNAPEFNPTGVLARELDGRRIGGARIVGAQIPVAVEAAGRALRRLIDRANPDAALAMGVAPGRPVLSVERVALNLLDFTVPDNRGRRYRDRPIRAGGPAAYLSTLPVRRILAALRTEGVPAELSNTAGTYLCNFAMFTLLDAFAAEGKKGPAGFIHVPQVPEASLDKPGQPSMDFATIRRGILVALREIEKATPRRRRPQSGSAP